MATGKLAGMDLTSANTDEQLYAVPSSGIVSTFAVSLANRNSGTSVHVRVALTNATSVANTDYICFDETIGPNEVYERSGLVLAYGQYCYVRSDTTGVTAVAYGYEETA